jgi:hypothetical protein
MRRALLAISLALLAAAPAAEAKGTSGQLRAGAGQADITPPKTGYYLGGFTRADRVARGQSTRLYANTLVLQRGTRKIALVAVELFAIPAGLQEDVARAVSDLGYDKTSVVLAASHTHSGPGGYTNNPTNNTAAPSLQTVVDPQTFVKFFVSPPADRQLYTFLVKQIAASVRRADGDRGLAAAAWGHTTLTGVTQNRSLFAFLRNYNIVVSPNDAKPSMDPKGAGDTIDPNVEVLRVDKLVRRGGRTRRVPIGAYSNFADHGTVVDALTQIYSGDHHASAWRIFTDRVRKAGKVPASQTVVNVYPNGAEGDMSAGLVHHGIAAARAVGTQEANAMYRAWRAAGRKLSRTPALDLRWTRTCFCGRQTAMGPVATRGVEGMPFLTGSEEERGPLYDLTHIPFEGMTGPVDDPVQGRKLGAAIGDPPPAVPIGIYRVGDGVIAAVPGEPTKQVGVHFRAALLDALKGTGVTHAVIGGLALDYIQYITTRAEYGAQSYEGGSTLYGQNEALFFADRYAELGRALAAGKPAPQPYAFDASYGVKPDGPPYPPGADAGHVVTQPDVSGRTVTFAWSGGPNGADRPVDKAFIRAERLVGARWRTVDTDLGLDMLWHVDADGAYTLSWAAPSTLPSGEYRLRVTATRYELISSAFTLSG